MQKFFYNKKLMYILNTVCLISLFAYLMMKLRYTVIANDDMMDYFVNNFKFYHGRFIESFVETMLICVLPLKLNQNIQDFAALIQAAMKSIFIIMLAYAYTLTIFKFFKKNILFLFFILLCFFCIIALLNFNHFDYTFNISSFYFGYTLYVPLFIFLLLNLYDLYTTPEKITKIKLIFIYFLVCILSTSNELYISSLLAALPALYILSKKYNNKLAAKHFLFLFIISCLITIAVIVSKGFNDVVESYNISYAFNTSFKQLCSFIYMYIYKLFIEKYFLWLLFVLYCISFIRSKDKDYKLLSFVLPFLVGSFIFYASLYLLGETNFYYYEDETAPKFWLPHHGFSFVFSAFILFFDIILISSLNKYPKIIERNIIIIISIISLILPICGKYNFEISDILKTTRETLYKFDKMSVFYFKQGKTAVLPVENADLILPVHVIDETREVQKDKIYNDCIYLDYLKKQYNVDSSSGILFMNEEDAINLYRQNGGILTEEELKKLRFSNIK